MLFCLVYIYMYLHINVRTYISIHVLQVNMIFCTHEPTYLSPPAGVPVDVSRHSSEQPTHNTAPDSTLEIPHQQSSHGTDDRVTEVSVDRWSL